jgi:hypothetical protein
MKKLVAVLIIFSVLSSLFLIASAEDVKINVMSSAVSGDAYGLLSTGKYVPGNMWDGIKTYNSNISATYCDFKFADNATAAMSDTVPKYNINGQTGMSDSIYLCTFKIVLDKVYSVSEFKFFGCDPAASSNIDGFDIWVSETGVEGSWTKVFSETEIYCGKKFTVSTEDGINTLCVSGDFNAAKVQYISFGLTQPRCQHTEELAKIGLTPNANPHYFRITELEVYGMLSGVTTADAVTTAPTTTAVITTAPATTAAPVTTKTPVTTQTPVTIVIQAETTTPADNNQSKGCGSSISALFGLISVFACAVTITKNSERVE